MKPRSSAWRRTQAERMINRRLRIVRNVWITSAHGSEVWLVYLERAHRYAKWNLTCRCEMCRLNRRRYRRADQRRIMALVLEEAA